MKTIPVEIKRYRRVGDEGMALTVESLAEVDDVNEIDRKRGCVAFLVMTDTPIGLDVETDLKEILESVPQNITLEDTDTPSQRLYKKIVVLYEKKFNKKVRDNKEDFGKFYIQILEYFGEQILNRIREYDKL